MNDQRQHVHRRPRPRPCPRPGRCRRPPARGVPGGGRWGARRRPPSAAGSRRQRSPSDSVRRDENRRRRTRPDGSGGVGAAPATRHRALRLLAAATRWSTRHPEHDWVVALPRRARRRRRCRGIEVRRQRLPRRAGRPGRGHAGPAAAGPAARERLDVLWLPAPVPVAVSARRAATCSPCTTCPPSCGPATSRPYPRLWSRLTRARAAWPGGASARDRRLGGHAPRRAGALGARAGPGDAGAPGRLASRRPAASAPAGVPADYLLYVGALEPRKGLDVLRATPTPRARAAGPGVGARAGRRRAAGAEPRPPRGWCATGRVGDAELAALYAGARATVLPSHLEGFGFTPLESLAAGTPVVVSDLPAAARDAGRRRACSWPPATPRRWPSRSRASWPPTRGCASACMAAAPAALAPLSWDRAADQAMAVLARGGRAVSQCPALLGGGRHPRLGRRAGVCCWTRSTATWTRRPR